MKKIKIIFLANNIDQNCIINNILKNIVFKSSDIEIFYFNKKRSSNKFFFNFLLNFINFIEKRFLIKKEKIIAKKNYKIKKNFNEIIIFNNQFLNKNLKKINNYFSADVIINVSNQKISDKFIKNSKYGLWEIDNNIEDNFFVGFWESFLNLETITSKLIVKKFIKKKLIYNCIDTSILNNKVNFWFRNKYLINIKSSNLIAKNLNKIFNNIKINKINNIKSSKYKNINNLILIKYICKKYLLKIFKKIYNNNLTIKKPLWRIYVKNLSSNFIIKDKNIFKGSKQINSIKGYEWADPFIFKNQNKEYVFFENNNLKLNRGKISCGLLIDNKLQNVKDVLSFKYHLSYPFLWKNNKDIYLIPESSANKSLIIWKSVKFPYKWKIFKTLFKNECCCDTTIIHDKDNIPWLFTNKSNDLTNDFSNELYVYKIIGNFEKIIPHNLNPVITNCLTARNAGVLRIKNLILRVSQINNSHGYGLGVNLNRIVELNLNNYKEEKIKMIMPSKNNSILGLHHISNTNDKIVFDVKK